jgi:hypothetical protein
MASVAETSNVAPLAIATPVVDAMEPEAPIANVPAVMLVAPEESLAASSVSLPGPEKVRLPLPDMPPVSMALSS